MTKDKIGKFFIITTLLIFPLPQLAIDLYLPSLPAMTRALHSSNFLLQLTLTVYILSLGVTQLIYGPCSDRFGRKPVLLIGTSIFFIGSIACALATSVTQLLLFRIMQGIGMGCGFTLGSAIIGDTFKGQQLARMTTFSSMIYALSPMLAPVLGGYLQHYIGWRANFAFITLFTAALLVAIFFFVHETNKNLDRTALHLKSLFFNYVSCFTHVKFISSIMVLTLAFAVMVTFNIVGPFLLQDVLGVSVIHYGQLLLLVGVSYFVGTTINSQLLKRYTVNQLITLGVVLMLLSSIGLLIAGWLGWFTATSVVMFTCIAIFATGFVFPNSFAIALEVFPEKLGAASALIGSIGLIGTAVISVIVAHIHTFIQRPLGYIYFTEAVLAIIFFWLASKKFTKRLSID